MPARSNKRQAVVYFVKKHRAPADATVTESEFLYDAQQEADREVDVVVRSNVGDDQVVISVEVTDRQRPADVTWVDSQLMKHSHMPTGQLLLVSWSGFTDGALRKITAQGGRVEAITPQPSDPVNLKAQFLQEIQTHPTRVALRVGGPSDERWIGEVPLNGAVYSANNGDEVGTVANLIGQLSNRAEEGERLSKDVYSHPDRESVSHYTARYDSLDELALTVDMEGDRLPVLGMEVVGELSVSGHEMDWEFWRLGSTLFALAEVPLAMGSTIYVLTPNDDETATVSWRPIG
jgi:hypothetical protein